MPVHAGKGHRASSNLPGVPVSTILRFRSLSIPMLIASLTLAATGCDMGSSIGSGGGGSMCLIGGCGGDGGGYLVAPDSVVIAQRDTTITLGDLIDVRVNVYPDSAFALLEPMPSDAAQVTWLRRDGLRTHVWRVVPTVVGTITLRALGGGWSVADSMLLQVIPRTP